MTRMIYHMCPAEAWAAAVATGQYTGTEDDRRDGFIHFSTAEQIAESARRHRAGQTGLVLIAVESAGSATASNGKSHVAARCSRTFMARLTRPRSPAWRPCR